jgi:hypothetical protein
MISVSIAFASAMDRSVFPTAVGPANITILGIHALTSHIWIVALILALTLDFTLGFAFDLLLILL